MANNNHARLNAMAEFYGRDKFGLALQHSQDIVDARHNNDFRMVVLETMLEFNRLCEKDEQPSITAPKVVSLQGIGEEGELLTTTEHLNDR